MGKFDGILLLSDLDGTLLSGTRVISPENLEALRYFMAEGGRFSVATGRSKPGMEHFLEYLPINAPAVIYNGAVVYDFEAGRAVWQLPLGERGLDLYHLVQTEFPGTGMETYEMDIAYALSDNPISRRHFTNVKMPWKLVRPEEVPQPWVDMLLLEQEDRLGKIKARLEECFPGKFFLQYSDKEFLEVLHPEANKGTAALALCEYLGISSENLYTVGDGRNDIQLLTCTKNAYAPANAEPEIKALCPRMLSHHNDHAIAALIAELDATR